MARRRRKSPLRWLLPLGAAAIIAMALWTNRQRVEDMLQGRGSNSADARAAAGAGNDGKAAHIVTLAGMVLMMLGVFGAAIVRRRGRSNEQSEWKESPIEQP